MVARAKIKEEESVSGDALAPRASPPKSSQWSVPHHYFTLTLSLSTAASLFTITHHHCPWLGRDSLHRPVLLPLSALSLVLLHEASVKITKTAPPYIQPVLRFPRRYTSMLCRLLFALIALSSSVTPPFNVDSTMQPSKISTFYLISSN